jgi:AcrR family transcriptional regulator
VNNSGHNNIRPALQERSREKRDRLIQAGLSVFAQHGYNQARMTDIAAEAGVSVGVLYQRFDDKLGLFKVIVDTLAHRLEGELDTFFDEIDETWSLQELIERLVGNLTEGIERDVGFFLALITVGEKIPSVVDRLAEIDHLRAQRLSAFLAEHALVDPALIDKEKVFFALATAIRMLLVTAKVDRDPIRLRDPRIRVELAAMLVGYLQS